MKTTIDIADELFRRGKRVAKRENSTFKELVEEGLHLALQKHEERKPFKWNPVTVKGGLSPEFEGKGWEAIRDAIYEGRGA
jgi:hypothetical protein